MDGIRFDRWARRIATEDRSRRGLLHLTLGAGAATFAGALPGAALACRKNGQACDPDKKKQCCSGTCKRKSNGTGVCKRAPNSFGCTIKDDTCNKPAEQNVPCPGRPERSCVILDNGRPFCAADGICTDCESDRDCKVGGVSGKCIKKCRACEGQGTRLRACVFAEAPTPEM